MAKRPELPSDLNEVWRDFQRLARSRPYAGMNGQPMPIPFDIMDRYARRFGPHTPDAFERWLTLIQEMDNAWLERVRAQQKEG